MEFLRAVVLVCLSLLALTGCVSTQVSSLETAIFVPEGDEEDLWDKAAKFDKGIADADVAVVDAELTLYLEAVSAKLLAHMGAPDIPTRIFVLPNTFLSAFALPNGSVYLHSGFLSRAENEAQLATVLAHELSHYLRRHSLTELRKAMNDQTASRVASALVGVLAGVVVQPGSLAFHLDKVQKSGYSRDNEREADQDALNAVLAAGYDIAEAPRVFELMLEEAEEIDQPFYLGSHPKLEERLKTVNAFVAGVGAEDRTAANRPLGSREEPYLKATARVVLRDAELNFHLGNRDAALRSLERHLRVAPASRDGHLALGKFHRSQTAKANHRAKAIAAYQSLVAAAPDDPAGHRELGLMLRGGESPLDAQAPLSRYLELAPEAFDRPIIEHLLTELSAPSEAAQ